MSIVRGKFGLTIYIPSADYSKFGILEVRAGEGTEAVLGARCEIEETRAEHGPEVDGDSSQLQPPSARRARVHEGAVSAARTPAA